MANKKPTEQDFFRMVWFCVLAIFNPEGFIREEEKDNKKLQETSSPKKEHRVYIVRRAFWSSFGLIVLFGIIGGIIGWLLRCGFPQPPSHCIVSFQVIGAILLLWGTLFVRGWEIQSWKGGTLSERVNQWIYRALCLVGTSVIICSIVWVS